MGRRSNRVWGVWIAAVAGVLVSRAVLADNYTETINGDLSGDRLAPTSVALALGANAISATSLAGDLEYFHVSVPPGTRLASITVSAYSSATSLSFLSVQNGSTFTQPPSGTVVGQLLGWTHFGAGNGTVGTDILDNLGVGAGAMGFSGALPSGDYTFWAQETSSAPSSYTLTFSVVAAPAPVPASGAAATILLGVALAAWGLRRSKVSRFAWAASSR